MSRELLPVPQCLVFDRQTEPSTAIFSRVTDTGPVRYQRDASPAGGLEHERLTAVVSSQVSYNEEDFRSPVSK